MYRRARHVLLGFALISMPVATIAQTLAQPTAQPTVTAENEPWYLAGSPIEFNGDLYSPAGTPRIFDPNGMARAGSYRGIPLYTRSVSTGSPTFDPNSIVLVPISGGRVQPYARATRGTAGTAALSLMPGGFVAQAPQPPLIARPYDLGAAYASPMQEREATLGAATPSATGTSGVSPSTTNRPVSTAVPPKGVNNAWIEYDGHRWIADGKAISLTPDLRQIGTYRGFPVYARGSARSTIYVPSTAALVVPYVRR